MLNRARTTITGITAAAMLAATSVVAVPMAAQAASPGVYSGEGQVILAGHRDGRRWHRHRHRDNDFPAALFGFGAGAIVGSLLAQPRYYAEPAPRYRYSDADAYCASKYRSYKPWTGTYTTYSGYEKPCP
jgi:hypothetical protein